MSLLRRGSGGCPRLSPLQVDFPGALGGARPRTARPCLITGCSTCVSDPEHRKTLNKPWRTAFLWVSRSLLQAAEDSLSNARELNNLSGETVDSIYRHNKHSLWSKGLTPHCKLQRNVHLGSPKRLQDNVRSNTICNRQKLLETTHREWTYRKCYVKVADCYMERSNSTQQHERIP